MFNGIFDGGLSMDSIEHYTAYWKLNLKIKRFMAEIFHEENSATSRLLLCKRQVHKTEVKVIFSGASG